MIDARTENNIKNISIDTAHMARDLHDIAVSLQILSGRTSLKKYILEEEINKLKVSISYMKNDALLFGANKDIKIKIQELETSLEQKEAELAAEEERLGK